MLEDIKVLKEDLLNVPMIEADKLLAQANEARQTLCENWKILGSRMYKGLATIEDLEEMIEQVKQFEGVLEFLNVNDVLNEDDKNYCYDQTVYNIIGNVCESILNEHEKFMKEVCEK